MKDTTTLQLRCGDHAVDLCPPVGGTVLRYEWRGLSMLRPTVGTPAMPRLAACYPLVPFSNRVGNGRLSFAGRTYSIPRTVHYESLPIHGLAWQRPWQVESCEASKAVLVQHYQPDHTDPAWPFPYCVRQEFQVDEQGLHIALALRNTGEQAQPAGLGWHPYFPRTPRTRVRADVKEMWTTDEAHLPLRTEVAPAALSTGMPVANTDYDNVFRGFSGSARIEWPELEAALTLRASDTLGHMVLFTPPGKPHIAVEPVSHMTDAFNRYAAAGGSANPGRDPQTGTAVLAPGSTLRAALSLQPGLLNR